MTTQHSVKTALITGASSGIGQELAKLFAKDGYNLILVARSEDQLLRLADVFTQNYGTEHITVVAKDLAKENAAQELYDEVRAKGITVNVLVNDAGLSTYGKFANETDWEIEKDIIHLNTITLTHLTKLYLKEMVQRNEGKVLNLASLVSIAPMPLMSVYAATKSFVYNFTASLVNELKGTNVTVTALMPNATDTDFFNKAGASDVKVTDELQDPAMVARDGYVALMKGEPKVVPGGIKNKMYEVMSHVAPQQATAGLMRGKMERKPTVDDQRRATWTWGIGIAAVIIAGVVIVSLLSDDDDTVQTVDNELEDAYDEGADQYEKASDSVGSTASGLLAGLAGAFIGTGKKAVDTKDELVDTAAKTARNAKGRATQVAGNLADDARGTLKSARQKAASTADSIAATAKDTLKSASHTFADVEDTVIDEVSGAYKTAKGKLADAGEAAHDRFDEVRDGLKGGTRTAYKQAKGARHQAKKQYEDVADSTTDRWASLKKVVTRVVTEVLS